MDFETPWPKYIQTQTKGAPNPTIFCLGDKEDIEQIYYDEFHLDGTKVDYAEVIKNVKLIWGEIHAECFRESAYQKRR